MKKILNILSSVKSNDSFSTQLSEQVLGKLEQIHPDSKIQTRNLTIDPLPHLEEKHVTAFYTPAELLTDEQKEIVQNSKVAIQELMDADILVIALPIYNFGIPSTLKSWIDHVVRAGVTFAYKDGVPQGLLKNKKVYLTIASGGIFSEGMLKAYDHTEPYLSTVLGFIGLTDITTFRVEGLSMDGNQESAFSKSLESIHNHACEALVEVL